MRKHTSIFPCLSFALLVASCVAVPTATETVTPASPTLKPSATLLPSKTHTPTITTIPIPQGAGFVSPSVAVTFHANLDDLPLGDYVLIRTLDDTSSSQITISYASLDDQFEGALITIDSPLVGYMMSDYSYGSTLGFVWFRKSSYGLFFLDLQEKLIWQFNAGCEDHFLLALLDFLPLTGNRFAFSCGEEGGRIWYLVSLDNGSFISYILPSTQYYGEYSFRWVTKDLALLWDGILPAESEHVCIMQVSDGLLDCIDSIPYWMDIVSSISPDGKWIIVEYLNPQNSDSPVFGLLPVECLATLQEDCEPTTIPDAVGGGYPLLLEKAFWSPVKNELALFQINCASPEQETRFWIYDLSTQTITSTKYYPGKCLYFRGWTSDGKFLLLVDNDPSKIWLASTETGELQRVASSFKNIIEVVGLIHVP